MNMQSVSRDARNHKRSLFDLQHACYRFFFNHCIDFRSE